MTCIECANWTPKASEPKLARLGFATCKVLSKTKGHTFSARYERDCRHYRAAVPMVVDKRREWLDAPSR